MKRRNDGEFGGQPGKKAAIQNYQGTIISHVAAP
jgi:hypothetical protein